MMICIDKNRPWLDRKNQFSYSGILFPELFKKFSLPNHESYYYFEKGKNILYFPKNEKVFCQHSIKEIEKRLDCLSRNIVSVKNIAEILLFINEAKIEFLFDKKLPEDLWVHKSDYYFISKHLGLDLYYWKNKLENKVFYKNLGKKPIHFYIINRKDKVVLNQLVSADIINEIGIKFCFGRDQYLSISEKEIPKLKEKLKGKNLEIMLNHQNMFGILQD